MIPIDIGYNKLVQVEMGCKTALNYKAESTRATDQIKSRQRNK